jgi:hypothetical protein
MILDPLQLRGNLNSCSLTSFGAAFFLLDPA